MSKVPRNLVSLGECLEIEFQDGTLYHPKTVDLCSSMSGHVLWVVKRRKKTKTKRRCSLYFAFHDFEPDSTYISSIPDNIKFKKSQKVVSVTYSSKKWNGNKTSYIHIFRKYPTAFADNLKNPSIIRLSGGNISIKPEGITG